MVSASVIQPRESDPDRLRVEPAERWALALVLLAALAAASLLLIVLPWIAGPPVLSQPLKALAWLLPGLALAAAVLGAALFGLLGLLGVAYNLLLARHALEFPVGRTCTEAGLPIILLFMTFAASVSVAGAFGWPQPAGAVVLTLIGVAGGGAAHLALLRFGWLHKESKGCCPHSTVAKAEGVVRIAASPSPTRPPDRAFAGDPDRKHDLLGALVEQRERGSIVRDRVEDGDVRVRLGCPVPCREPHVMHRSLYRAADESMERILDGHHRLWRGLHGVPARLSALEFVIFNNLPRGLAEEWPIRFVNAIPVGADLTTTADRWLLWLLDAPDSPLAPVDERLAAPAALLRRRLAGAAVAPLEWSGVPGFSSTRGYQGAIVAIAGAAARAGAATSELDAAREMARCAALSGHAATRLRVHAMEAGWREAPLRAAAEASGFGGRVSARARWFAGISVGVFTNPGGRAGGRAWRQAADQLIVILAAS